MRVDVAIDFRSIIVDFFENVQYFSEVYQGNSLIKSPQRTQSSDIPVTNYEKTTLSRLRTRMKRIARIFTDPRVSASSAQSVFYSPPPGLICVHPRLISSMWRQGVNLELEKVLVIEKPQRAQRTQRKRQCSVLSECSVVLYLFFLPATRMAI
jgi:hypothetical protein